MLNQIQFSAFYDVMLACSISNLAKAVNQLIKSIRCHVLCVF